MMENTIHEDKQFEKQSYADAPYPVAEHEDCQFEACDFSNTDLSGSSFSDCGFDGCQFSMTKLRNTSFRNVIFKNCKMLGLHFEDCNPFLLSIQIENCSIKLSSFCKMNLKKMKWTNSSLHELDFSEADLSSAIFEGCDLQRSIFTGTNLEKADLRTSFNYSIEPERNRLKKAKFSLPGVIGLLDKHDIQIDL
jgi:uncharacterized protein YjbI with pentapeptide repeats